MEKKKFHVKKKLIDSYRFLLRVGRVGFKNLYIPDRSRKYIQMCKAPVVPIS